MELWTHVEERSYPNIILHDCQITRMRTEGDNLVLDFEGGFWLTNIHPENDTGETVRTGPSQMIVNGCDWSSSNVRLLQEYHLFRRSVRKSWREFSIQEFVEWALKKETFSPEFVYEYFASLCLILQGRFSPRRPFPIWRHEEWQMEILCKTWVYCWNELDREAVW